jgi:hypothetical protein
MQCSTFKLQWIWVSCRFGDRDGTGTNALLQHPLAVLATGGGKGESLPLP